jgi:hypothetical protein
MMGIATQQVIAVTAAAVMEIKVMKREDIKNIIFSNPSWKAHFLFCHEKHHHKRKEYCNCINHSSISFNNVKRIATCLVCHFEVKNWYPQFKQNEPISISEIILSEEEKFLELLNEKEPLLQSLKSNLNGETLSWIHQTHGIDPDLMEDILGIKLTELQKTEYEEYYSVHRLTGKAGFKPKIISII